MSKKIFLFKKTTALKETLFDFLNKNFSEDKKIIFPKKFLEEWISKGFVSLNDKRCTQPHLFLKMGDSASCTVLVKDIKRFQKPVQARVELNKNHILYEDEHLVCINKPAGIPTHATLDPERDHLVAALKRFYKSQNKTIPYLALHHRLDSETSGVIFFCKNKNLNKDFSDLFSNRDIEKIYLCITPFLNNVPDHWEIKNHLMRSQNPNEKQKVISCDTHQGDFAHTSFEILGESEEYLLVQAQPHTGRTHQIRVHLFEYGIPILGDPLYQTPQSAPYKRMFLHAWKLNVHHPVLKKELQITAPVPDLFQEFFDFKIE